MSGSIHRYACKILIILTGLLVWHSCGPSEREKREAAQRALAEKNIPYSNERFLQSVREGDSSLVVLFIQAGMYPDLMMRSGTTPLMIAAAHRQVPVVKVLIKHGADVNAKQQNGAAVLDLALLGPRGVEPNSADAFIKLPDKETITKKTELVGLLIKAGAEVEDDSYTLLMQGIRSAVEPGGNTNILQMLLEAGADVNQRPAWGKSILMFGIESMLYRPNLEVVRLILERGAEVNDRFVDPRKPGEPVTAFTIARDPAFRKSVGSSLDDQLLELLKGSARLKD
jgi:hypothetical protein